MTDEGMWAALASMEAVFEQRQNITVLYDLRAILLCAAVPSAPPACARQSSCKCRSRQFATLGPLAPLTAPLAQAIRQADPRRGLMARPALRHGAHARLAPRRVSAGPSAPPSP